jgi:hypothetical protein
MHQGMKSKRVIGARRKPEGYRQVVHVMNPWGTFFAKMKAHPILARINLEREWIVKISFLMSLGI